MSCKQGYSAQVDKFLLSEHCKRVQARGLSLQYSLGDRFTAYNPSSWCSLSYLEGQHWRAIRDGAQLTFSVPADEKYVGK